MCMTLSYMCMHHMYDPKLYVHASCVWPAIPSCTLLPMLSLLNPHYHRVICHGCTLKWNQHSPVGDRNGLDKVWIRKGQGLNGKVERECAHLWWWHDTCNQPKQLPSPTTGLYWRISPCLLDELHEELILQLWSFEPLQKQVWIYRVEKRGGQGMIF